MNYFLLITCFAIGQLAAAEKEARPNIVFILADDLGYGELGCYGQEKIRTPNIDQLAVEGLRFTHHYSGAPVCAPARCVLLTGKHLAQAEIRANKNADNNDRFLGQWPLSAEAITLPKLLQKSGYKTAIFGKWGLGPADSTGSPNRQGFDYFYGYISQRNAHSYFPPHLYENEKRVPLNKKPIPGHVRQPTGEVLAENYRSENYAPDAILSKALAFIDTQNAKQPFFLYLPFVEPHLAIQSPQEWIDQYPESWDAGNEPYRGKSGYTPHPRPRAAYAAMISDLDEHVGTVMEKLRSKDLLKNTLVVFTSDNGTSMPAGGVDPEFFNSSRNLRGHKATVYEGGLRVPAIIRWPEKVKAGTVTDFPSYFPDWLTTLTSAAGISSEGIGNGINLLPLLSGEKLTRDQPMLWEFHSYGGQLAAIDWPWKAVRKKISTKTPEPWQLYHLKNDPSEAKNLAEKHPKILSELILSLKEQRTPNATFKLKFYGE